MRNLSLDRLIERTDVTEWDSSEEYYGSSSHSKTF